MDTELHSLDGFPVGSCSACTLTVLAYLDPTAEGVAFRCLHCDAVVELLGQVPYEAIEEMGYGYVDGIVKQGHCSTKGYCTVKEREGAQSGCGDGNCGAGGGCEGCH
jgi:hypothetical protein